MAKVDFKAIRNRVKGNARYTVLPDISAIRYLDQFCISDSWLEVDEIRCTHDDFLLLLFDKRELLLTQKCELSGEGKPLNIDLFFNTASGITRKVIEFQSSKDWYVFSRLVVLLLLPLRTPASLDAEQRKMVEDLLPS